MVLWQSTRNQIAIPNDIQLMLYIAQKAQPKTTFVLNKQTGLALMRVSTSSNTALKPANSEHHPDTNSSDRSSSSSSPLQHNWHREKWKAARDEGTSYSKHLMFFSRSHLLETGLDFAVTSIPRLSCRSLMSTIATICHLSESNALYILPSTNSRSMTRNTRYTPRSLPAKPIPITQPPTNSLHAPFVKLTQPTPTTQTIPYHEKTSPNTELSPLKHFDDTVQFRLSHAPLQYERVRTYFELGMLHVGRTTSPDPSPFPHLAPPLP